MNLANRNSNFKQRFGAQSSSFAPASTGSDSSHTEEHRVAFAKTCINKIESIRCNGKPIITGIERVAFGTRPASEMVSLLGMRPPRYLFYMISGMVCDVIQFLIDVCFFALLEVKDASVCWALGFFMSIIFRHTSHRYLVFGDYVGGKKYSIQPLFVSSFSLSLFRLFFEKDTGSH